MPSFHWQDEATGLFYKGTEIVGKAWQDRRAVLQYAARGRGKRFSDVGKAKLHVLWLIGHFEPPEGYQKLRRACLDAELGSQERNILQDKVARWELMHPGYFTIPDWLHNSFPIEDIPSTWKLVEYDSEEKIYTTHDFNVTEYLTRERQLRHLVDRFGVSVKEVFKKIEKKNALSGFTHMVVIGPDFDNDELLELLAPENDKKKIDEGLKNLGIKRTDIVKTTVGPTTAIAFKNLSTLVGFRLGYTGKYPAKVLDLNTLTELVD